MRTPLGIARLSAAVMAGLSPKNPSLLFDFLGFDKIVSAPSRSGRTLCT
jgi:hypothetical protein